MTLRSLNIQTKTKTITDSFARAARRFELTIHLDVSFGETTFHFRFSMRAKQLCSGVKFSLKYMTMPKRVPDRWEDYTAVGERIAGTRFISFKVPLHQGLSGLVEESDRMTPCDLVAKVKSMGHKLGLVVDLTNTSRYYNYKEIEDLGICYHKIHTEGHVVPSKAVRKNFFASVDEFLHNNVDNDLLVGVHCTHGVNRTGYLVCKYMITRLNFPAKDAIAAFNMARGHPLERSNYIADLWNSTPG
ncbi:RNA/RNP complex-1-interacting phosphatase [Lamellibrachia satsuma]|nr:RNA/RNP complex-1-interacting phosphatase [Lamellibrachia satsuma]